MNKTSHILLIRPVLFGYNTQTAASNSFQISEGNTNAAEIQNNALLEFNQLTEKLKKNGVQLSIFEDTVQPHTPDSIFPNNWISFHENNTLVLYPMLAENRRAERRTDIVKHFQNTYSTIIDLSDFEKQSVYLEGTGSIIFDYDNQLAYASISPRTDKKLFELICAQLNFQAFTFKAIDSHKNDIYHTNVLMCIGNTFAVLCADCILDENEKKQLVQKLENSNHEIIYISYEQMNSFAGNMYQLFNDKNESLILMSEQAFLSLNSEQVNKLKKHGELIHSPLYTIEKYGGGSARCMIADIRN